MNAVAKSGLSQAWTWALTFTLLMLGTAGCGGGGESAHEGEDAHGHGHAEEADETPRGPHGGRLFKSGDVQLELRIHEDGIPPEFRAYLTDASGKPLSPGDARLSVALDRFGGRRDSLLFKPGGTFLRSTSTVDEPHSFVARIHLEHAGVRHDWSYEQVEGRLELQAEAITEAGIATDVAGPRAIDVQLEVPGEIRLDADRVVQVRPRFPGEIRRLTHVIGDRVAAGEVLAVVHSNESLSDYEITSPIAGTIVAREAAPGESVDHEKILFTVADLTKVWAYFPLYPQFANRVRAGQPLRVRSQGDAAVTAETRVAYVGPLLEQDTRISYGRATLDNRSGRWTPGLYVNARVTLEHVRVAVAVPEAAIVRMPQGPAVFRADGQRFELQPVELGRTDGTWTEIVAGLAAGDRVVVTQTFLLKAELGKSEATHDH
jgi:cobalt-zinc-cadmium efflux system membrane fusion protein